MDSILALRLLGLILPAVLGVIAGRVWLFKEPQLAISNLNTYALNIGFPVLVALGLAKAEVDLPDTIGFWLVWPLSLLLVLVFLRVALRDSRAATLGLVAAFGNIAYLGLPYVTAVYGEGVSGSTAMLVSLHATLAVTVGPAVLLSWSGGDGFSLKDSALKIVRLPLVWAPFVGLALRSFPVNEKTALIQVMTPVASSAAPVALFMLGLYLYQERAHLVRPNWGVMGHVWTRQLGVPLVVLVVSISCVHFQFLTPEMARVHVVLSSMPVAITTFSIAFDARFGHKKVGAAIVWSSILAFISLPAWTLIANVVF